MKMFFACRQCNRTKYLSKVKIDKKVTHLKRKQNIESKYSKKKKVNIKCTNLTNKRGIVKNLMGQFKFVYEYHNDNINLKI